MLHKMLRRRAEEEKGFTLIELLVVILIIGILAAIAIPSFLNQKGKASDAQAKSLVRTAATAMETYSTQNNGSYAGATAATLNSIEPAVNITSGTQSYITVGTVSAGAYALTAASPSTGDAFTITNTAGSTVRSCTGTGGGCVSATW
jgi:type IV pilus assembly protein PilA